MGLSNLTPHTGQLLVHVLGGSLQPINLAIGPIRSASRRVPFLLDQIGMGSGGIEITLQSSRDFPEYGNSLR
jgi:hypothetical protein